jgi:putative DNA primase/helicase
MENININPEFEDLSNPETFKNELLKINDDSQTKKHAEILNELLGQIEKIDFIAIAHPKAKEVAERLKKLGLFTEDNLFIESVMKSAEKAISEDHPESEAITKELSKLKKFKLSNKHYLVITIDNILKVAENNSWGLCRNHDFIYLYNGEYWANIEKDDLKSFLGKASEKMGVEKHEAKYHIFRDNLLKQFLATAYRPAPKPDKDVLKINLKNGTFEIDKNGNKLEVFKQSDFMTYQLPFDYDKEAEAPIFQKYLNTVLPDVSRQNIVSEYLGYVFIKDSQFLKLEKALILFGSGANGKSVLFEVINSLLGAENVSNYSLSSLTDSNGYYRAMIANKLVNYASELNGKMQNDLFKQMTSGEPIEARLPYGNPMTLTSYAKLIFNANELPKDVEHSNAYFRRFLIVPFDVTIPEDKQDKQLSKKIIESELSGVFNWVLSGLQRLLKQKNFSECEAVKQALEAYKTESNSIQLFLIENDFKSDPKNYRLFKEIYFEYKQFCIEDGMFPFKKGNFSNQLKSMGFKFDRQAGTGQTIIYLSK